MLYNKAKGLFFITVCLAHISANAMEITAQQKPAEQMRSFPTLRQLCNQAVAPSLVKGSVLCRSVDRSKITSLRELSIIPEDLVPGLECAAQEYRDKHPGLLPIVSETTTSAANVVLNADFLPNQHSFQEYQTEYTGNHTQLLNVCGRVVYLANNLCCIKLCIGFFLNDKQKNSNIWCKFKSGYSKISLASWYCEIPLMYPIAAYVVAKPTQRKVALAGVSAGLVGYGLYKYMKK